MGQTQNSEKDGDYESFPQRETNRLKQIINVKAFELLLPELRKTASGKFIAMFDGEMVASGEDEWKVLEEASESRPPGEIAICKVAEKGKAAIVDVGMA